MVSSVATGALNQVLHTPVVQCEPNTFHNSLSCSSSTSRLSCQWFRGRSSRKLKKHHKHPLLVGLNKSLGFLWGQQQLQQDVCGQAAGRLVSAQQQQPVVVGLGSIAQDPAVVTQKIRYIMLCLSQKVTEILLWHSSNIFIQFRWGHNDIKQKKKYIKNSGCWHRSFRLSLWCQRATPSLQSWLRYWCADNRLCTLRESSLEIRNFKGYHSNISSVSGPGKTGTQSPMDQTRSLSHPWTLPSACMSVLRTSS